MVREAAPGDLARCLELRLEVFVRGQGVPLELEQDGLDTEARHFLASVDGRPVGTARMRSVSGYAKAERVAVLGALQGAGVGRAIMLALQAAARDEGLTQVVLNAQEPVVPFYLRLGYEPTGPRFMEAGIPHIPMRLHL